MYPQSLQCLQNCLLLLLFGLSRLDISSASRAAAQAVGIRRQSILNTFQRRLDAHNRRSHALHRIFYGTQPPFEWKGCVGVNAVLSFPAMIPRGIGVTGMESNIRKEKQSEWAEG